MSKEEQIHALVEELLRRMSIDATILVTAQDDRYLIQLNTDEEAPYLIGRYGETLVSLQRIIEAMMYKTSEDELHVLVNVNDYREHQKERLESIADNLAQRVMEQGREAYLRSFSAYERKIIHEYISQKYPDLTSRSEDEGHERKLVISRKTE
jgi:spoIIIJ-associated protein